jgi:hypothetical protein
MEPEVEKKILQEVQELMESGDEAVISTSLSMTSATSSTTPP